MAYRLEDAARIIAIKDARITKLEEALKPFSEIVIYPLRSDEYMPRIETRGITHESVNKARALLTTTEDKP